MFKIIAIAFTAILCIDARAMAQATYYSIDVTNDVLYRLNAVSGNATPIGALGVNLESTDLAWHDGALYAKSYAVSSGAAIHQIVTSGVFAGRALSGAALNGSGYVGAEAAGLASNGASLFLTYSIEPVGGYTSNRFGRVNPLTGGITYLATLATDADAMGFSGSNFWSYDNINASIPSRFYRGPLWPDTYVGAIPYDTTQATNPGDMEHLNEILLLSVSTDGRNLLRIYKSNGARGAVTAISGAPANAVFRGLALEPKCITNASPVGW